MKQLPNIIAGLFFILAALLSLLFVPFKGTVQFCLLYAVCIAVIVIGFACVIHGIRKW